MANLYVSYNIQTAKLQQLNIRYGGCVTFPLWIEQGLAKARMSCYDLIIASIQSLSCRLDIGVAAKVALSFNIRQARAFLCSCLRVHHVDPPIIYVMF